MAAIDRFKGANTKFSERGEYLIPIMREEQVKDEKTGQVATKLVYDSPANYTLKIKRCIWKTARPPKKDEWYLVEFEVVKSNNPRVPVGALRTWMQGMDNDAGPTAVTDFMFAALGYDRRNAQELAEIKRLDKEEKIPGMLAETLDDPTDPACQNALSDFLINVEVKEIITKEKKQKFNLHSFFPEEAQHKSLREAVFGDAA